LRLPSRILDAGCGFGRVASELTRLGHLAIGVDADPDLIELANEDNDTRFVVADLATLNLRNELHANQHNLTKLVMEAVANKRHTGKALAVWEERHALALERYDGMLNEFSAMRSCDFATVSVAVSEVGRLVQLGRRESQD